jgi:AbrB family looped-hinge helix DNA binding protein
MMPIFKGKVYGSVTIGERGQLVIPAELRKELKLKTGD